MKTLYIDMDQHQDDPLGGLRTAMRSDPDEIVFIGDNHNPFLEEIARHAGHKVRVLPPGSEAPQGASLVLPSSFSGRSLDK